MYNSTSHYYIKDHILQSVKTPSFFEGVLTDGDDNDDAGGV